MTHALAHRLIAHRGWQARYVENSQDAVTGAISAGARHIEIDIQLSADGVPVLFHDRDLKRLCGRKQAIHTLPLTDLLALTTREPGRPEARIATLEAVADALRAHPDITLYVELKRIALKQFGAEAVLEAIATACKPILAQIVLISFDLPALQVARQLGWARLGPVIEDWPQLHSHQLDTLDPDVVFVDGDCVPKGASLETWPWPLAVYEVGDAAGARHWFKRGASLVETFDVGGVIEALGDD